MRIGEMAARFGINTRTLRYYERCGLVSAPARTQSNYRVYEEAHARRLSFVLKAKRIGLTLHEIKEVLSLAEHGVKPCERVRELIEKKIRTVEDEILRLTTFHDELFRVRDTVVRNNGTGVCSIIDREPFVVS